MWILGSQCFILPNGHSNKLALSYYLYTHRLVNLLTLIREASSAADCESCVLTGVWCHCRIMKGACMVLYCSSVLQALSPVFRDVCRTTPRVIDSEQSTGMVGFPSALADLQGLPKYPYQGVGVVWPLCLLPSQTACFEVV